MNDFKNYINNGPNDNNGDKKSDNNNNNENISQTINTAKMLTTAFSGKSESQIYQLIISQAEQGKRNGTLTNADLDNFYAALSPMLDNLKRKKLAQIINKIKEI
jgi:hypothetical protein